MIVLDVLLMFIVCVLVTVYLVYSYSILYIMFQHDNRQDEKGRE